MDKKIKSNHVAIMAVVILVVAVVCGGVGYKVGSFGKPFGSAQGMLRTRGGGMMQGQGPSAGSEQARQAGQGRRHTEGEILSIDDKGVTVKLADGSSKIVLFSDSTTYALSSAVDKSKVVVGQKVDIVGDPNTDGSVSASEVRIVQTI